MGSMGGDQKYDPTITRDRRAFEQRMIAKGCTKNKASTLLWRRIRAGKLR